MSSEPTNLPQQRRGRAAFVRKRGEIKNADLMEQAATELETRRLGRPELPPDERRDMTIRIRATRAEAEKFDRLGAAEWFRAALKRAKET